MSCRRVNLKGRLWIWPKDLRSRSSSRYSCASTSQAIKSSLPSNRSTWWMRSSRAVRTYVCAVAESICFAHLSNLPNLHECKTSPALTARCTRSTPQKLQRCELRINHQLHGTLQLNKPVRPPSDVINTVSRPRSLDIGWQTAWKIKREFRDEHSNAWWHEVRRTNWASPGRFRLR
ncbi:hypothetical protein BKA83DRAFT_1023739 [Pisolithus microcarpus]|nr:hypothetical protein BKA83DRAFT_1023739 [Pisolithus microcarpus]